MASFDLNCSLNIFLLYFPKSTIRWYSQALFIMQASAIGTGMEDNIEQKRRKNSFDVLFSQASNQGGVKAWQSLSKAMC